MRNRKGFFAKNRTMIFVVGGLILAWRMGWLKKLMAMVSKKDGTDGGNNGNVNGNGNGGNGDT